MRMLPLPDLNQLSATLFGPCHRVWTIMIDEPSVLTLLGTRVLKFR